MVLPLVCALALWALLLAGRQGPRTGSPSGSRSTPTQGPPLYPFALAIAACCGLVYVRPVLLPLEAERVLIASLFLILVCFVALSIGVLRRSLGTRLPLRPSAAFFLLPLAAYLAFLPWSTAQRPPDGDEPWYLIVAHSLTYDFDNDLANNYREGDSLAFLERRIEPQLGDPQTNDGRVFSRHPVMLPLLVAPGYRIAGKHGALVTMALLSAALAWMTLRVASHYWPKRPGEALLGWSVLAFAPPLLLYSYQLWAEVPAALAMLVVLDRVKLLKSGPASRLDWLIVGAAALVLVLLKLRFVLLLAPLAAIAFLDLERYRRRVLVVGGLLGLGGSVLMAYNWLTFDNPLRIHSWNDFAALFASPLEYLNGVTGLFFDLSFGLFAAAPIWALVIPATTLLLYRPGQFTRDLILLTAPYLIAVAARGEWYGGWSPPFRYPMVLLPLLALALTPLLATRRHFGPRVVLAFLCAATLVLSVVWIAVPGWTYNFAHGRNHLVDHYAAQIGADVARLFPSGARPRLATLLWPPAVTLVLVTLWSWRPRKLGRSSLLPTLVGVGGFLLACAAIPFAAQRATTRAIEAELTHVTKTGGHPDPHPWVVHRTRFPEAWVLREGDQLQADVVAGGDSVLLELELRSIRNHPADLELRISSDGHELGSIQFGEEHHDRNQIVTLGPFAWDQGDGLKLTVSPPGPLTPSGVLNGIVLDRIRLHWSHSGE